MITSSLRGTFPASVREGIFTRFLSDGPLDAVWEIIDCACAYGEETGKEIILSGVSTNDGATGKAGARGMRTLPVQGMATANSCKGI